MWGFRKVDGYISSLLIQQIWIKWPKCAGSGVNSGEQWTEKMDPWSHGAYGLEGEGYLLPLKHELQMRAVVVGEGCYKII